MTPRLSRRNFLKTSAAGGAALAAAAHLPAGRPLAAVAGAAAPTGRATTPPGDPLGAVQTGFAPLPSTLPAGYTAPADLAAGWDGTLWAIDGQGAPAVFDPLRQAWDPHGGGIDAALWLEDGKSSAYFRGPEVLTLALGGGHQLQTIAQFLPVLPPSFQLGIDGAANVSGVFFVFKGGRYARSDSTLAPAPLAAIAGWPQTPAWQDGVVDLVGSGTGADPYVVFIRDGEALIADLAKLVVTDGPFPLDQGYGAGLTTALGAGQVDALLYWGTVGSATTQIWAFGGPTLAQYTSARAASAEWANYLPARLEGGAWPATWHPTLAHAPAGRVGALWATAAGGAVLRHDGAGWADASLPAGAGAVSVAAGADGSVYAVDKANTLHGLDTAGPAPVWKGLATAPVALAQVTAGDAGHVWVRDSAGAAHRFTGGAFASVPLGVAAAHLAANDDGTLWHCAGGPAAYRFISEGAAPSEALPVGVASVRKVTSTGFGRAHLLAQQGGATQVLRYESPFLFKTGPSYNLDPSISRFDTGLGNHYVLTQSVNRELSVVALDALSGRERWSFSIGTFPQWAWDWGFARPVFDPGQECVYAGALGTQYGFVALDARTGALRGTLALGPGVGMTGAAAVQGTTLVFGDSTAHLYAFDTAQLAAAFAAGQQPAPLWKAALSPSGDVRSREPLLANGQVYATIDAGNFGEALIHQLDLRSGQILSSARVPQAGWPLPAPPVLGTHRFGGVEAPALIVCTGANPGSNVNPITALGLTPDGTLGGPTAAFGNVGNVAAITYHSGVVYFGTYPSNTLYGLDQEFKPVPGMPYQMGGGQSVNAPAVVADASGRDVVFVGNRYRSVVVAYQPASGTIRELDTGQSVITALSPGPGGIIYAGGAGTAQMPLAQLFAIRADVAIQELRAFIVESQLLQDYDEPQPGQARAVARYQTHLTVVDDVKAPQPGEAVTIWADAATTILVDGRPFPVDPQTPAAVQTGPDGRLTIVSDAGDLFTPALRVWASFMDPFERMVIHPDQEFHARLATATVADPADDDPDKINLATATTYGKAPLFGAQQQGQAGQAAQAIGQMARATGLGTRPQSPPAGAGRPPAVTAQVAAPSTYVAYPDLPGLRYSPVDTPAVRPAGAAVPLGLSLDAAGAFAPLSPAAAAAALDALQGQAPALGYAGWFDFFERLWDDIKKAVVTVEKIVVAVADDVVVGIQYVANGVRQVFRAIVRTVEDIARSIGTFFVKLGKEIVNVVEALSLFFHLDEIIKTKDRLKAQIAPRLGEIGPYVTATAIPAFNQEIDGLKREVIDKINQLKGQFGPKAGITRRALLTAQLRATGGQTFTDLPGAGATPHTLFTAGPKGGAKQSYAVQGTWAMDKVKQHAGAASVGGGLALGVGADPFTDALNAFLGRLENDPQLKQVAEQTKADFQNTFKARSASEFLNAAVVDFLDLLEVLVVGALTVVGAFVDGVLTAAADLFGEIAATLEKPIDIPVLSALYKEATGSDLSILDLVLLVGAIPVTILYRAVEGRWPSQDLPATAAAGVQDLPPALLKALGILGALNTLFGGFVQMLSDTLGQTDPDFVPNWLGRTATGIGAVLTYIPLFNPGVQPVDIVAWVLGLLAIPISFVLAAPVQSVLTMVAGGAQIGVYVWQYVVEGAAEGLEAFLANLFPAIAAVANPAKLAGILGITLVEVLDFFLYVASAVLQLAEVIGG